MFGFLRATRNNRVYRQVYSGCCAFQHAEFGITTLPLFSYESVFLYLLAMDAGECPPPDRTDVTCCRLRRSGRHLHAVDAKFAEFCSAFGLLLASIKLEDDVRDDRSLLARIALWQLRGRIERAHDYFSTLDASFRKQVKELIQRHLELENNQRPMTIEEYAKPTAEAFSYVVGLYHHLLPDQRISEKKLTDLGSEIGRAIICFDCAVDWKRDRQKGRFNPLPDETAVGTALLESQRSLSRIAWICREDFGSRSIAASVAGATFERVQHYVHSPSARNDTDRDSSRFSRRPNLRWRRKGDCDCCCDPSCCDPSCCEAGGGDGCPVSCPNSPGKNCLFDCCPCDCCTSCEVCDPTEKQRESPREEKNDEPSRLGSIGKTSGPLNPTGVVEINGNRIPAKSEGDWIDANTEVEIIRDEEFGVVVRPR